MTAADLRYPKLIRLSANLYRFGPYVLSNHPRVLPRCWVVTRDGHHISEHATLRAGVESLGGAA